ncbi:TPR repeat family protein [Bacteroides fragilis str. 1007-1-F |nr:TPR repeat family protein [Bacteroides fragilis str. 1007-1-F \
MCMEECPDSALVYLHQISDPEKLTGENQADYCLLLTQAMDKNDLPLSSDSLIQIAVGYYSNKGDAECKAKALFYKGRVFQQQGNLEGATLLYKKAESMIPDLTDYYLVGLIYSYLGHLNRDEEHYKKALLYYEKALPCYRTIQNPTLTASGLQDMAKISVYLGETHRADSLFSEVLSYVPDIDAAWQANIYHNVGVFYMLTNQFGKAEQVVNASLKLPSTPEDKLRSYAVLATIYTRQNRGDLVDSLWHKALNSENIYTRKAVYASLLNEAVSKQNLQDIEHYVPLYIQSADSVYRLSQAKRIVEVQAKYDQEILIKKNKISRLLLYCFILCLLLLAISLAYVFHIYKRYKRAKERELITQRAELDEGKQVIKEMNDQIERIRKEASTMKEDYNKSLIDLTDEKKSIEQQFALIKQRADDVSQTNNKMEQDLLVLQKQLRKVDDARSELLAELDVYRYFDAEGVISEDCYKAVVTIYKLYNAPLVAFLRDPHLKLTPYESLLCVLSYEHLSTQQMEQKLGKSKNTLNKAIFRIREKLDAKMDLKKNINSLGDFLRTKF